MAKKQINNFFIAGIGIGVLIAVIIPVMIFVFGVGNDNILPQENPDEFEIPFITPEQAVINFSVPIETHEDELTGEEIQPEPITEIVDIPETNLSYIEQLFEKYNLGFTGKFGVINTVTIHDTNGDVLDTSANIFPLSVSDIEGNILDLATIEFKFDAITSEKSNVIGNAIIDLLLDNVIVETRELKINGNTVDNSIPFEVRKGFIIDDSLNFTLSDKGKNWIEGSLHELKLIIRNIDVQTSSSSGTNHYVKTEPLTFYLLELKQDEFRKVIVDETTKKQISIPKSDDKIQISGNSPFQYAGSCDNAGCTQIASYEGTSIKVKVLDSNGDLVKELTTPTCISSKLSTKGVRSTVVACTDEYIGLSRITNYTFQIDAKLGGGLNLYPFQPLIVSDTIEYTTPSTQQNLYIFCETVWTTTQRCGSNIGWTYP